MSAEHHGGGGESVAFYDELLEASAPVWGFLGQIFLFFLDAFDIPQQPATATHH
jgi:hypothetical protein